MRDNGRMTPAPTTPIETRSPATNSRHPYESLTPDTVQDALEALGLSPDGRLMALNSYENRVYLAHLEEPVQGHGAVVVKFYRPGRWTEAQILEEHAFGTELQADEVPVVAPLVLNGQTLHQHGGFAFSVCPRKGGRAPELDDFEVLEWVGRFLARIHTVGAAKPFVHRPALDAQSFGQEPHDWLIANNAIPLDVQAEWQAGHRDAMQLIAESALGTCRKGINDGQNMAAIRLHGDCHPGNILWTPADLPGGGPHFVDLDDARSGPAVQDLWMLTSGDRSQRTGQLSGLLDGYEQVRSFNRAELALIEPLRTLRLIHYSAWLARRWDDPTFPANFPWFGSSDYWRGQVQMLHEQIEAMQEPALMV